MKTVPAALLALGMLAPAFAQDVDRDDVPRQCDSVCANIVAVSDQCDRQFSRDRDELDCMCRAENAQQVVPLCAACIDFYDTDNDNDNDVEDNDAGDLRRECGFAQTSFDPSSSYNVPQMTAATNSGSGPAGNAGPTPTSNQAPLSSALNSLSSSLATATTTNQASLSSVVQSISSNLASSASSAAGAANTADSAAVQKEGAQAAIAGVALLAAAALL